MRARLFFGIFLVVCAIAVHAAGQGSGDEGREPGGGNYPRALPEAFPDYPWIQRGEPGSPLPGVRASGLQEDLLLLVDDAAAPLAEALVRRLEAEGYRETALIRRVPEGELSATLQLLVEQRPRSRRSVGRRGVLAIGAVRPQDVVPPGAADRTEVHRIALARRAPVFVLGPETPSETTLSREELRALWFEAERWSQVDPAWPETRIQRVIPENGGIQSALRYSLATTAEAAPGVAGNTGGLEETPGGIALREYMRARGSERLLAVDGVPPSDTSISRGEYPLSMEVVLMVPAAMFESVPTATAFALFAGSSAGEEVLRLGWVPEPPWQIDRAVLQALAETY